MPTDIEALLDQASKLVDGVAAEPWPTSDRAQKGQSVEALLADAKKEDGCAAGRPWPLRGTSLSNFDEAAYQRACQNAGSLLRSFFVKRQLVRLENEAFVVAAFETIVGHQPGVSHWQFYVDALNRRAVSREALIEELLRTEAGRSRGVVPFDEGHLRTFVEATGIGLQDVLSLLFGLLKRQAKWRIGLLLRRIWNRTRGLYGTRERRP